jgi:hypothetical protein
MSAPRLIHVLERYGSQLSEWPWRRRLWLYGYLCRSVQARRLWQKAQQQEQWLACQLAPSALPQPLERRLRSITKQPRLTRPQPSPPTAFWLPLGLALACSMTGIMLGTGTEAMPDAYDLADLSYELLNLIEQHSEDIP